MQKVNNLIADKLCKLSSFLNHACEEFESIAKQIKEKNIRMSLRSFAIKTKQYSEEIKSKPIAHKHFTDKKIIELCCNTEEYFVKAYRSILNEYFPYTGLRDMLIYQLSGIKNAFRQLKLLKSVMTSETPVSEVLL